MPAVFDSRVVSKERLNDIIGHLRIVRGMLQNEGMNAEAGVLQHQTYLALAVAEKMWEDHYASDRK